MTETNNEQAISNTNDVQETGKKTRKSRAFSMKSLIRDNPHVFIVDTLQCIVQAIDDQTAQLAKIEQLLKEQQK